MSKLIIFGTIVGLIISFLFQGLMAATYMNGPKLDPCEIDPCINQEVALYNLQLELDQERAITNDQYLCGYNKEEENIYCIGLYSEKIFKFPVGLTK